ncbi:oxamate carbamoyltransferase subunit AllH family protein [Actinomadura parmotrematis]|uniref:DUF2877 domain-containing protein n=1 Tax=Actinomadura parmotrematis TaxID=2864039 RepID=A0ABS7FN18_9ACTN|nr:DUF2877 domain-containing protein [Actinomadura parmotrematis]MBW8480953.1 DUF2877 domain-containing protein [Actinomadura parmotrematis]
MTALARHPVRPRTGRPAPAGAASLALREALSGAPRTARVLAVFPAAVYLELRDAPEPRVLAVVASDAARPPNAVVVAAGRRDRPFRHAAEGGEARIGDGRVEAGALHVRVRRWWDPRPALGAPDAAAPGAEVLRQGTAELARELDGVATGLAGHPDPALLAARCAAGDLAGAVEAAERIVGLGPGLTPAGDDIIAGLLIALRAAGGALGAAGARAVWLADWLGAAVTADAGTRTTPLAATLLHCAAEGGAGAEVAGVLRGAVRLGPLAPAVRRLLAVGHTSGADLAHGVLAGCRAALALGARTEHWAPA